MSLVPAYLSNNQLTVKDNLAQYVRPPRVKIVQALSKPPIKPPFQEGDVILTPYGIKLPKPFTFTPIIFFPNWVCMNPIQTQANLPVIREVSLDPNSEIARKARMFVQEPCPENPQYNLRYAEGLNFFIRIDAPEVKNLPAIITFSRGEYKTGQTLIGFIQVRKAHYPTAPMFSHRYDAVVETHTGKIGSWYGLGIFNSENPWVSEEEFHKNKELAEELQCLIKSLDMTEEDVF